MKRREFVRLTATSAIACTYSSTLMAFFNKNQQEHSMVLQAAPENYELLKGVQTPMWTFSDQSLKSSTLLPRTGFLGPMIEARRGDILNIEFKNKLPEPSIIHWHGLHLDQKNDGHPSAAVGPGESYHYRFQVDNRAGLYWYHPHPHGRTGFQVYQGLAGLFVVRDAEEEALNLPANENELFLVFQDRHFDEDNNMLYVQNNHDMMMGKMGNTLVVNGGTDFQKTVKSESYRLRVLNGSNARFHNLQWSDGRPLTIIGTDGGLLDEPKEVKQALLSPGERLDIIVQFENNSIGDILELLSAPLVESANAKAYPLYQFEVTAPGTKEFQLPEKLSDFEEIPVGEASNQDQPKSFQLYPKQGLGWTIDGLKYEMGQVREKERIKLGSTEIWEFDLTNAGMIHPMHIHGSQFQVVERIHGQFSKGLVFDHGWKDTVSVLPGDKVRVIKRFHDHEGLFLFHCHILEHEDNTMMRDFKVYS